MNPFTIVKGIILPLTGGSVTIPVRLFSDRPMGEWSLSAAERLDIDSRPSPTLSFSFDRTRGQSGDTRWLTITRAPLPSDVITYPSEVIPLAFVITSTSGSTSHQWIAIVGNE